MEMLANPLPDFLVDHPDGEVRFVGSRIALYHVVDSFNRGYSPELILGEFPSLNLLTIYKAVVFYLENRQLIDAYMAEIDAEVKKTIADLPRGPSLAELRRRMEARSNTDRSRRVV